MSWRDDEDLQGNFLSCKEGEKLKVKVKEIRKIVGGRDSRFHYKYKDGTYLKTKDTGEPFHHELETNDGKILTVGSLALIGALKKAKVEGGMEIEIDHSGRGKYDVKSLSEGVELDDSTPF